MNPNPIDSYLAAFRDAEASRMAREKAIRDTSAALAAALVGNLSTRMKAEVLPLLEVAAASIRGAGSHAVVTTGEPPFGFFPWVIAITMRLECATRAGNAISDLGFIAEVNPSLDAWQIRSHVISQAADVRDALADATFHPGGQPLFDFVTSRVTAFVKAAFPIIQ